MNYVIPTIHWLAGLVVLAEALNKLERTNPTAKGLSPNQRLVDVLKSIAWAILALGAGGALMRPLFGAVRFDSYPTLMLFHQNPSFADTLVLLGFALLIVRTRVKEG